MNTTITKSFKVDHSIEQVWKSISDPEKLVNCLPGASLTETVDDKNYKGEVTMKFGPVKAKYNGLITFEEMNVDTRTMKMIGKGMDSKGKGSADMEMNCSLTPSDTGTQVDYTIGITITGMLAQFGSRMITDVSNSVFDEFTKNFKEILKGEEVDNTMDAGKISGTLFKSIIAWIRGIFGSNS